MKLVLKLPLTLPRPSLDVKVVQVEVVQEGAWVSYTGESVRSMEGGGTQPGQWKGVNSAQRPGRWTHLEDEK